MDNKPSVIINDTSLEVKEFQGQRVVTFKDIDSVHNRPDGTARRNFNAHKEKHIIEGTDFFKISADEFRMHFDPDYSKQAVEDITLITESGYLMLVKSFTDDLAWTVQRQLVNSYFRDQAETVTTAKLSPQLQMAKSIFDSMVRVELQQQEQQKAIEQVSQKVDGIRDVVALSPNSWREECRRLLARIAQTRGGGGAYREVSAEAYQLLDERAGASLETRLTNKRRRMADEGICKSRRDKLTRVDVIADDKRLIEIYIAVVKDMAIRYGVDMGVAV